MPFQKGNKLSPKKHSEETKRKISEAAKGRVPWNKGRKSPQTTGERNGMWLGINAPYHAIHQWLLRYYGKADRCELKNCLGRSNSYEWALIKGKKYRRMRENFFMLCKSCHRKYDLTKKELSFMRTRERNSKGRYVKITH